MFTIYPSHVHALFARCSRIVHVLFYNRSDLYLLQTLVALPETLIFLSVSLLLKRIMIGQIPFGPYNYSVAWN